MAAMLASAGFFSTSACSKPLPGDGDEKVVAEESSTRAAPKSRPEGIEDPPKPAPGQAVAIFAGGCFWCMETAFEPVPGVVSVTSGYIGGEREHPTYELVSSRKTRHAEAVMVIFDPKRVSYDVLLDVFWHNVDPTTPDRQFCDRGPEYRSEIFVLDAQQRARAEASKRRIIAEKTFAADVVTPITDAGTFWPAETYHQDFYKKNPARYHSYRRGCGRDARLDALWGRKARGPFAHRKAH